MILLLLAVAMPLMAIAGSSSVTAETSLPLMYNNTTLTIAPFYEPTFGVHIVQGADPVGAYWVNVNPDYLVWSDTPSTGTVKVTIYGTDGETPYANAIIAYYDAAIDDWNYQNHVAADGTFTFNNVPVGEFSYTAYDPEFSHCISDDGYVNVVGGQTSTATIVAFQM